MSSAIARISAVVFSLRSPNHFCTALLMFCGAATLRGSMPGGLAVPQEDRVEAVGELLDQRRGRRRLLSVNDRLVVRHVAERDPALGILRVE